jgi:transposase-like protein
MPIVEYKCNKCKKVWDNYADARACEKSHLRVKSAHALRFVRGAYPLTVEVTFENGVTKTYIAEEGYTLSN